jgi:hypothetical protein
MRRLTILLLPLCLLLPRLAFAAPEVAAFHDGLEDLIHLVDSFTADLDRLEAVDQQLDAAAGTVGACSSTANPVAELEHLGTVVILKLHPSDGLADHAIGWLVLTSRSRAKPPSSTRATTCYQDCSRAHPDDLYRMSRADRATRLMGDNPPAA